MLSEYPLFTVFSGLYNSSSIIHRLFKSIEDQEYRNFEWIIVNDASIDSTMEMVEKFVSSLDDIKVRIISNYENKGIAYGRLEALKIARGKYFVSWDHDDLQLPDQLHSFASIWEKYDYKDIGSIASSVIDEKGVRIGRLFPTDIMVSTYFDVYSKFIMGERKPGKLNERHMCCKTDKFIETISFIQKEKIIELPEIPNGSEVWCSMALLGYKTIYTNKILRQYFIEPSRDSMSKISRKNGAKRVFRDRLLWLNYFIAKLPFKDFKTNLRTHFSYCLYGCYADYELDYMLKKLHKSYSKVLVFIFYLPAKMFKILLK